VNHPSPKRTRKLSDSSEENHVLTEIRKEVLMNSQEIHVVEYTADRALRARTVTQLKATRLLDAWVAGDRRALEYELSQWRAMDLEIEGAEEREHLLFCLVQQMMDEPDLFAPRSEKLHLGVWVDLLTHLTGAE
jgi:hypothetical protein